MPLTAEEAKKRLALKKAAAGSWSRAKNVKPTKKSGGGPPAPIDGGGSRFVGYTYDLTEKGDPYFRLKFVVLDPDEHAGKQFSLFHFINDSQFATKEDCLNDLCSDLQMIGGEGCTSEVEEPDESLFALLDDLSAEKPFVEFHSWTHKFKSGKRKGETENRAALDGPITPDGDKDWYDVLSSVATEYETEDDQPGDPEPPPARGSNTAAARSPAPAPTAPAGRGRTSRAATEQAAPAEQAAASRRPQSVAASTNGNGKTPTAPPAESAAPAPRRGGRPAVPPPEPEPTPAEGEFVPQVDEHYGLLIERDFKEGRKTVTKQIVAEVIVLEVDEAAGTCTVQDLQQMEYTDVPFSDLQDAPPDEIPF